MEQSIFAFFFGGGSLQHPPQHNKTCINDTQKPFKIILNMSNYAD